MKTHSTRLLSLFKWGLAQNGDDQFTQVQHRLPSGTKLLPGVNFSQLLTNRLVAMPRHVSQDRSSAFLSSRLPRDLGSYNHWFSQLRSGMLAAKRYKWPILSIDGTTCARFLDRAGSLFGVNIHRIKLSKKSDCSQWLEEILVNDALKDISVSPPISDMVKTEEINADQLLSILAATVWVVDLKSKSKTQTVVAERLHEAVDNPAGRRQTVLVSSTIRNRDSDFYDYVLRNNGVAWQLRPLQNRYKHLSGSRLEASRDCQKRNLIPLSQFSNSESFLFHCTRAPNGGWPDESEEEYLKTLLMSNAGSRTRLDTLCRIIRQKKLWAGSLRNRGQSPVVSFSENSLQQLIQMRVFRPHLSRWDFEPVGIGITKEAIMDRFHGRPVIYAEKKDFFSLPKADQPYFQVTRSRTRSGKLIDWTKEREWRIRGDVDFSSLPNSELLAFAPDRKSAERVSQLGDIRTVVLDE